MAKKKLNFLKKYPDSEYAIDLKFKERLNSKSVSCERTLHSKILYIFKNGYQQLIG